MLNQLELRAFKCFETLKLPLGQLTLLSGSNASGKSSALQALVLLHQTMREHEWSKRLMLNGAAIKMGTVADIVDKVHGRHKIGIGLIDGNSVFQWEFSGDRLGMSMSVDSVKARGVLYRRPSKLRYLLPPKNDAPTLSVTRRLRGLTYITAERVGPREVYDLEDRQNASVVGPAGEAAVSLLHWGRDETVMRSLALTGVPPTLMRQVEARMGRFFPGCSLTVQQVPQANAVTLGLRTTSDTDYHRPIHVGFGLTQVLPIVVAALLAKKRDLFVIENPEVHLHPAGQVLMGQFLAEAARSGVQVIVETHSDHILNGIRRAVKARQLRPQQAVLHFFRPRSKDCEQVVSPQLDESGNIDNWPDGFFDQFDKDMNYFAGWGK